MNGRGRSDIESNGHISEAESELTPIADGIPFSDGSGRGRGGGSCVSDGGESMYEAARTGNWEKAKDLTRRVGPSLVVEEITEMGDRALHVAVNMKHIGFVREMINLYPSELEKLDGRGYTACCYSARTGNVSVAQLLTQRNPKLGITRNSHDTTPLQLAAYYGNTKVVLHFLDFAKLEDLQQVEWFHLLLLSIRSNMYGVALKILEKDGSLAVMKGVDQRTAIHVLAQLDISSGWKIRDNPKMRPDLCELAKKLWEEMRKLDKESILELIEDPPVLHDAAKVGNVELITMITRPYPELLWRPNEVGHTIFHIAVMYRQESMLQLIKQSETIIDFNAILQDENDNNILHLAGKVRPPDGLEIVHEPDVQMKKELAWFKEVEKIVPPYYREMRNKKGYKPREVFWSDHKGLLEESVKHMKSTAESCMLIATIILTLVFAAAFTPPGGYDDKGTPILLTRNWFASFVIFEVLALFTSTYSILTFWSILSYNYDEDQFLSSPNNLRHALAALLLSVLFAISAFLSAFFLVFVGHKNALILCFMLPAYGWLVVGVSFQFFKLFPKTNLLEYYSRKGASPRKYSVLNLSLWRFGYNILERILSSIASCFKKFIISPIASCFKKFMRS